MLIARDIYKSFDKLPVLRGISMELERGDVVAIIGPSGSGKSTFLRCLTRLEQIDSGYISVDDEVMVSNQDGRAVYAPNAKLHDIGRKMGMVFQSFNLFPHFSVLRNLTEAPIHVLGKSRKDAEAHAAEDAQRKEEVETRNNADSLVNATQQTLDELGDKAPADAKAAAESAIAEAKSALEGNDIEAIKASVEKLQQAGYKLAEVVYSQNGGDPAAAAAAAAGAQGGAAPADDDTIEADYEVVDDDKKEGK